MVVLDSPAGAVGVDPRQPAQDVQDEALSVLRAGPLLGPLTEGAQQLLVEVQELQHGTALDSRGAHDMSHTFSCRPLNACVK